MHHQRYSRFVGWKTIHDRTRPHHPKMNGHPADRGSRMYWCRCFPGIRIEGRDRPWLENFWQQRQTDSRSKYNIKLDRGE